MKKIIITVLFGLFLLVGLKAVIQKPTKFLDKNLDDKISHKNYKTPSLTPTLALKKTSINQQSIFVPYWQLNDNLGSYDRYFYFGITANKLGINQNESGYQQLNQFLRLTEDKKKYLVLRLLDDDFNQELLTNENLQEKIIQQTLELVKEKNFEGLVLDLELFNLFNSDITDKINNFVKKYYTQFFNDYKIFGVLVYGDVFYRHRPFDLAFLGQFSDEILIMAYDFSKTIGEPGPNFPFDSGLKYNYSFKKMINDYLQFVPPEKLTVVFGMFGYEWVVDEKRRPLARAKALTINQIKEEFCLSASVFDDQLECCQQSCLIKRDKESAEVEIDYVLSANQPNEQGIYQLDYHIVWTEDQQSIATKTNFLKEKGINSVGYWAHGYF